MRLFLISLLSLFFLSGCEDKDPASVASGMVGEWEMKGKPTAGLVLNSDGTGFLYSEGRSENFTWRYEGVDKIITKPSLGSRDSIRKFSLSGGRITSSSEGSYGTWIYERSK